MRNEIHTYLLFPQTNSTNQRRSELGKSGNNEDEHEKDEPNCTPEKKTGGRDRKREEIIENLFDSSTLPLPTFIGDIYKEKVREI